jgi:4-methylaminobutanoate oxidase (formaldehyde-forming)
VGKDAILAQKQEGALRRRLVHVLLDDPEPLLFHGEPILWNEDRVGYVRSGAFGHTLGASVGMGFIERAEGITGEALAAGRFAVDIAGRCVPAKLSLQPFYDPKSERVRR